MVSLVGMKLTKQSLDLDRRAIGILVVRHGHQTLLELQPCRTFALVWGVVTDGVPPSSVTKRSDLHLRV